MEINIAYISPVAPLMQQVYIKGCISGLLGIDSTSVQVAKGSIGAALELVLELLLAKGLKLGALKSVLKRLSRG